MSTKTTFKRIALVTVAALGTGVLASAPSQAAPSVAYTNMVDTVLGQQEVGGLATVTITLDTATISNIVVTGVGSVVSATPGAGVTKTSAAAVTTGSWTDSTTVSGNSDVVVLTSAVAGTTTITVTPTNSDGTVGTAVSKNVTWVTTASKNTWASSAAYIFGTTEAATVSASTYETADSSTASLSAFNATLATGSGAAKAIVWVKQYATGDTTTVSTLAAGKGKDIKVEISGAGSLSAATTGATGSVISVLGTATAADTANLFYVYSDGRSGEATITITVGTTVTTKKIKFVGAVKSYAEDATNSLSKKYVGVSETATITINEIDGNGVKRGVASSVTGTSDTPTVATISANSSGVFTITGVKEGVARFKFTDGTNPAFYKNITVTKKTAATVAVAFDKTAYNQGDKVTWTVTAKDSTGAPIADGSRAVFGTVTTNLSVAVGTLPSSAMDFVDGVATGFFYAPAASGNLVITVADGTEMDRYTTDQTAATAAGTTFAAAKTNYTIALSNDAIEAANAATTAALAANDAVDALAATVAKLVANLKAQITALTKLIVKIQKKVGA